MTSERSPKLEPMLIRHSATFLLNRNDEAQKSDDAEVPFPRRR